MRNRAKSDHQLIQTDSKSTSRDRHVFRSFETFLRHESVRGALFLLFSIKYLFYPRACSGRNSQDSTNQKHLKSTQTKSIINWCWITSGFHLLKAGLVLSTLRGFVHTAFFCAIMYKLKNDKLYWADVNLLYSSQYGFCKGHSTQHAILEIINDIQSNITLLWYLLTSQKPSTQLITKYYLISSTTMASVGLLMTRFHRS